MDRGLTALIDCETSSVRCVPLLLYKTADGTSLVPLRMTFSMIGKFGITGSFGIVFLYTPEIFPTTLRYVLQLAYLGSGVRHWVICRLQAPRLFFIETFPPP